mmetsp:Transcript_18362/g.23815  ORF Transcript_18362/g.23815 Transcript_18362/m.23815 type:complete len:440 (+) Transcript_18362:230-1549(+)
MTSAAVAESPPVEVGKDSTEKRSPQSEGLPPLKYIDLEKAVGVRRSVTINSQLTVDEDDTILDDTASMSLTDGVDADSTSAVQKSSTSVSNSLVEGVDADSASAAQNTTTSSITCESHAHAASSVCTNDTNFFSTRGGIGSYDETGSVGNITYNDVDEMGSPLPKPLKISQWAEPDSDNFAVRGENYLKDKRKIRAGHSIFKLMTVDLVEVDVPIYTGMCNIPSERVQQSLANGTLPPFVFAVNIIVPGEPCYHLVMYFKVDESQLDIIHGKAGTPFSKLANRFFFEGDDKFRDETFKLIPRIIKGNFVVRKAVGSTPAIMGTKLKQYYSRGDRYFELILDVSSSKIASHVVGLAKGFAKHLIVDMAFVLEGKQSDMLPERVLGCCRLMHVSFNNLRTIDIFKLRESENVDNDSSAPQKRGSLQSEDAPAKLTRTESNE